MNGVSGLTVVPNPPGAIEDEHNEVEDPHGGENHASRSG